MKTLGVIELSNPTAPYLRALNYHPLVAYNIQVLRNLGCDSIAIKCSFELDLKDLIWKYDLADQADETSCENVIKLNGLNPILSSTTIQRMMKDNVGNLLINDCFNVECAIVQRRSMESTSIELGLSDGFSVDNDDKWQMMLGLLEQNLVARDFPKVVRESFAVVERGAEGKPRMLFTAPYAFFTPDLVETIEKNFQVTYAYQAPESVVADLLANTQIWVVSTCPPYFMGSSLFSKAQSLEMVATPSTGTNHLDKQYLLDQKIPLLSIKESPVIEEISASSEMSLTLLVSLIKKLNVVSEAARLGTWREQEAHFRSEEFQGKRIGLIGLGRIGRNMARYAQALLMDVVYFDPNVSDDRYTRLLDLKELLQTSDVVSLHYHLNGETKLSFGAAQFKMMKSGSYFLNTARGELVDELAMLDALRSGHLKAAAIDVISDEHIPNKWDHPVIKYARNNSNLIVSPHVAGLTVQSESKAMRDLIHQVLEYRA